jgi:electron transfer flavoprotein beta subunit
VPAMLAERLGWPQATVVVKFTMEDDLKSARVDREVEGGHEEIHLSLPAVIAAQKGLNEPRYASLKGIMAAKKKPIEVLAADDLGLTAPSTRVEVLAVSLPSQERKNRRIEGEPAEQARELARLLHEEEKLI